MNRLSDALKSLINQSPGPFENIMKNAHNSKILKDTSHSRVVSFGLPEITGSRIVYKEILEKSFYRRLKKSFEVPSGLREEKNGRMLFDKGFWVPKPIMAFTIRKWGLIRFSGCFSFEIPDLKSLNRYLSEFGPEGKTIYSLKYKRKLITVLGEAVGKLHGLFFYHGDLRANHIILSLISQDPKIGFIDCEASRLYNKENLKWLIRDLRKLRKSTKGFQENRVFTNQDKLRFFKAYIRYNKLDPLRYKNYLRLVNQPKNEWD